MSLFACSTLFDFFDDNSCLLLRSQSNVSLEFSPLLFPTVTDALPVRFVQWQGFLKPPRQELLTFEIQAVGRIRFWLEETMQVDVQSNDLTDVVSFSFNVSSMNTVMFVRMECHGQHSEVAALVFWSSKRMSRQVSARPHAPACAAFARRHLSNRRFHPLIYSATRTLREVRSKCTSRRAARTVCNPMKPEGRRG